MKNKQTTATLEKYLRIHEEIKRREHESEADDPDGIGDVDCGGEA